MRPEEYAAILGRRWWLPLLCGLLAALIAYLAATGQPVVYEASTRLLAVAVPLPEKPESLYWPDLYVKNRLESYRQIAASALIATRAVERAQLPISAGALQGRIATRHSPSENTLTLAVRDGDRDLAAQAVNALADALVACLNDPACDFSPSGAPQVRVTRLDTASPPPAPTGVQPRLNAAGGALLGLALGLLLAVLIEYLDDVLRTPADIGRALATTTIGRLPGSAAAMRRLVRTEGGGMPLDLGQLPMVSAPASALAEAYRVLRTNILFARTEGRLHSLLVVGIGDERASDVVANLAVATAQAGVTTLVIDANLRQPVQHAIFGVPNECGLTALLGEADQPTETGQPRPQATAVKLLTLLPAGSPVTMPAELLGRDQLSTLLTSLASHQLILVDGPPLGRLADAAILATKVDSVLLVIRAGQTRRRPAIEAKATLERVGARLIGTVLIEENRRLKFL